MSETYAVFYPTGKWCMTTDMQGLVNVFRLAREARDRIIAETSTGADCKMHFSRETPWATNDYIIRTC